MPDDQYPIDLGKSRDESMPEVSKPEKGRKYYPSLYLTWDEDYELPDSGTMTITFEKKSESNTKRDGEKSQSVEIEVHSIESVEEGEPDDAEPKSRDDDFDKLAKRGKYKSDDGEDNGD